MPASTREVSVIPQSGMLSHILEGVQRKPKTLAEAVSLLSYITEKDIVPLVADLKRWLVADLKPEEKAIAEKIFDKKGCGCFGN